jgi:hypothetical protein
MEIFIDSLHFEWSRWAMNSCLFPSLSNIYYFNILLLVANIHCLDYIHISCVKRAVIQCIMRCNMANDGPVWQPAAIITVGLRNLSLVKDSIQYCKYKQYLLWTAAVQFYGLKTPWNNNLDRQQQWLGDSRSIKIWTTPACPSNSFLSYCTSIFKVRGDTCKLWMLFQYSGVHNFSKEAWWANLLWKFHLCVRARVCVCVCVCVCVWERERERERDLKPIWLAHSHPIRSCYKKHKGSPLKPTSLHP